MSYAITGIESTPNPNAIKCVLDRPISAGTRSFLDREMAVGDPLALRLFAITGVTCVMFCGRFVTVNKAPDAGWGPIKRAIHRALADAEPNPSAAGF